MTALYKWATRHHVSMQALDELQVLFGLNGTPLPEALAGRSEQSMQSLVRLEAAEKGLYLWRNNVGAGHVENGGFMRWGLANESKEVNKKIKSGDLIGIRKLLITADMVGLYVGQFVSREMKRAGWRFSGTEEENAQLAWAELILANGGDAGFATGPGSL